MDAAAVVCAGAVLSLLVPCLAAARPGWRPATVTALLVLAAAGLLAATAAGPGPALAAVLPLAGLCVALGGATRLLRALRAPAAAAAGAAALAGCGLLVLPFLGDALVEWRGPGRASPAAVEVLLSGCPTAGALGGGLGVDLLRSPRAYGGPGREGLSRIGAFYAYRYPRPWASGAGFAAAGAGFLLLAAVRRPR
jgi:hypothetical protein